MVVVTGTLVAYFGDVIQLLLGVQPSTSHTVTLSSPVTEPLNLIGMKMLPRLQTHQAKEVTPFEVGDEQWKPSLARLTSGPVVICAFRARNAVSIAQAVARSIELPHFRECCYSALTPQLAYRQAVVFFQERELFVDPEIYRPYLVPPSPSLGVLPGLLLGPQPLNTFAVIKHTLSAKAVTKAFQRLEQVR